VIVVEYFVYEQWTQLWVALMLLVLLIASNLYNVLTRMKNCTRYYEIHKLVFKKLKLLSSAQHDVSMWQRDKSG